MKTIELTSLLLDYMGVCDISDDMLAAADPTVLHNAIVSICVSDEWVAMLNYLRM